MRIAGTETGPLVHVHPDAVAQPMKVGVSRSEAGVFNHLARGCSTAPHRGVPRRCGGHRRCCGGGNDEKTFPAFCRWACRRQIDPRDVGLMPSTVQPLRRSTPWRPRGWSAQWSRGQRSVFAGFANSCFAGNPVRSYAVEIKTGGKIVRRHAGPACSPRRLIDFEGHGVRQLHQLESAGDLTLRQPAVTGVALAIVARGKARAIPCAKTNAVVSSMPSCPVASERSRIPAARRS